MATQYTIIDDSMPHVGSTVHVWRVNSHPHPYINHVPDGLDASSQRVTSYGIRGDGEGEDSRVHYYIGAATVISRDFDNMMVTVEMQ